MTRKREWGRGNTRQDNVWDFFRTDEGYQYADSKRAKDHNQYKKRKNPRWDMWYQNSSKFKDKDKIIKNRLRKKNLKKIVVRLTATMEIRTY